MATYVKYDDIEGDATDIAHKGWIKATLLLWEGIQRPITAKTGATWNRDTAGGRPQVGSVIFTKFIDRASPRLMMESLTGNKGRDVYVETVKANGDSVVSITLRDAIISHYDVLALDSGHNVETIGINFTNIQLRYFPYDSAGKSLAPQSDAHNLAHARHHSVHRTAAGTELFHRHFHRHAKSSRNLHKATKAGMSESERAAFIQSIVSPAQWGETHFGVPASVTIAQAILESYWGKRDINNNYFGIQAQKNQRTGVVTYGDIATGYATAATHEYNKKTGKKYPTDEFFRIYRDKMDSVRDHAVFLHQNPRYRPAFEAYAKTGNADEFAHELKKATYATDPKYDELVIGIMKRRNLYKYDARRAASSSISAK